MEGSMPYVGNVNAWSVLGANSGTAAGGWGGAGDSSHSHAGFPVHITCMAICGDMIATAAGTDITVWDLSASLPRARIEVNGHGSVTSLILHCGTLIAGDNSGYLRAYEVCSGLFLHEIRAHADRVTAIDTLTLAPAEASAMMTMGGRVAVGGRGGVNAAGGMDIGNFEMIPGMGIGEGGNHGGTFTWDQGLGWGEGWVGVDGNAVPPLHQLGYFQHGDWGRVGLGDFWSENNNAEMGKGGQSNRGEQKLSKVYIDELERGEGREDRRVGKRSGVWRRTKTNLPQTLSLIGEVKVEAGQGVDIVGGCVRDSAEECCEPLGCGWSRCSGVGGSGKQSPEETNRIRQPKESGRSLGEDEEGVQDVLFTASDDCSAMAWDLRTGRFLATYGGHTKTVTCLQAVVIKGYGPVLVTGSADSRVLIWELSTGHCVEELRVHADNTSHIDGFGYRVSCLQAYESTVVVGLDRRVVVWSLVNGERPVLRFNYCHHQRPVRQLQVVGRWLFTCSGDYVIRVWDIQTGKCIRDIETQSGAAIMFFRLSGLSLFTTSLFNPSVLISGFLTKEHLYWPASSI
ncbi:unnamed protein product [Choristocarpus tenellus]